MEGRVSEPHAALVGPGTIGSWEGTIAEHSRVNLAPLRAPLRDPSTTDGLPSLCSAIDAIEGHSRADPDALGIAATRTLMTASSIAVASSGKYVEHGTGQWTQPAGHSGAHAKPTMGDDDDEGMGGSGDDDESSAERRAQLRAIRQRVEPPVTPSYQMQGVPHPQQQLVPTAPGLSNGHAGLPYPPHHVVPYAQQGGGGSAQPMPPGGQPGGHPGQPMVVLPNGVLIPAELCAIAQSNGPPGMAGMPQQMSHAGSAPLASHAQHSQAPPAPRPRTPTKSIPAIPRHPTPRRPKRGP